MKEHIEAIDHERKKLHDSIIHIASEDMFKTLCELLPLLHHRQALARHFKAYGTDNRIEVESVEMMTEDYNKKIKYLLNL